MNISVIIPCYNSEEWLSKTVPKIVDSLKTAKISKAEIIIVDDGSTDDSYSVAKSLSSIYPIIAVGQNNKGRFLARKAGIDIAEFENILLIDTRVFLDKKAITFVSDQITGNPDKKVWNGHVNVYKKGNIIARFMDTVTNIGWRRYFSNPRTCDYGLEDFDYYPKGTGCFFVPKPILNDAIEKFISETKDIKNSSDDTLLIRIIASQYRINLSPEFSCTYFARNNIRQFIPHTFNRGRFFVDGFLIPGTRFYMPLITILVISPIIVVASLLNIKVLVSIVMLGIVFWIFELFGAILLGIKIKDALSFWILTPLFAILYFAGIWRAVITRALRKRDF